MAKNHLLPDRMQEATSTSRNTSFLHLKDGVKEVSGLLMTRLKEV